MSDVLLIYPYRYTGARHAQLFHPLGIAQLAAILRREGIDTSVVDCTFLEFEEALREIISHQPRLVGLSVMMTMLDGAMALAGEIRRLLPETLLVCGGPLPTLQASRLVGVFHAVFRGEAVCSFPRFCRDFLDGKIRCDGQGVLVPEPKRYCGLFSRTPSGEIATARASTTAEDLAQLPLPDRSDYDHRRYQKFWRVREGWAPAVIMTSYGCPHECEFCSRPIFGRRFRRLPVERILEEILAVKELGYSGLRISDDSFLLDQAHARLLCGRIVKEKLDVSWTCLARVDQVREEDIRLMRQAGCRKVYFGLESGDDSVLRLMRKKSTVHQAEKAVKIFSRCGIGTAGFFMVGYPGETPATVEKTLSWALSLPLDEISFTIPYPLSDTPLYHRVGGVVSEADWSYENENSLVFRSSFDEAYLKRRIAETVARFNESRGKRHA